LFGRRIALAWVNASGFGKAWPMRRFAMIFECPHGRLVFPECRASDLLKDKAMATVDFTRQLDKQLRFIEMSAREYDNGNEDESIRIATSLRVIFRQTSDSTSLLRHLNKIYTNLFTSVHKRPYPTGTWTPLVDAHVNLQFPDEYFVSPSADQRVTTNNPIFKPLLDGVKSSRYVSSPDWWDHEPAFLLSGSRITRWNIVNWAANKDGGTHVDRKLPTIYEKLQNDAIGFTVTSDRGQVLSFSCRNAHFAALRQMAYEISKSPELFKLAGR
jgi:hypothetical protein